jgi:hypothetical protein
MNTFLVKFNRDSIKIRFSTSSEKVAIRFVNIGWYILINWLGLLLLAH